MPVSVRDTARGNAERISDKMEIYSILHNVPLGRFQDFLLERERQVEM